jgi:hypothetical protein
MATIAGINIEAESVTLQNGDVYDKGPAMK